MLPHMRIAVVNDLADLAGHTAELEELAKSALEPNVFYEPFLLLPAVRNFQAGADLVFLFIYCSAPQHAPAAERLVGFYPIERKRTYYGAPVPSLSLWCYNHCSLTVPLIRRDDASDCVVAFLNWLATNALSQPLCEFGFLPVDGPTYALLVTHFRARRTFTLQKDTSTRALLKCRDCVETYLREAISPQKRRDLERKRRRLSELGKLEFRCLQQSDDLNVWLDAMFALEASGWKGAEGTALAMSVADRDFFASAAEGAFRRGQLLFLGLMLDRRWIALRCSFLSSPGAFFFKPAYDESLARNSPGVILELETICDLHRRHDVAWMDSCTSPDNELLNRLWLDRRTIARLAIATGKGRGGELVLASVPLLRWIRRRLGAAKTHLAGAVGRRRPSAAGDSDPGGAR